MLLLLPELPLLLLPVLLLPVLLLLVLVLTMLLPTTSAAQPIIIFASPTPTTPPSALLVLISAVKEYYEHSLQAYTHTHRCTHTRTDTHMQRNTLYCL